MTGKSIWPCSCPGDYTDGYGAGGRHNYWCDSVKHSPTTDAEAEKMGQSIATMLRHIEGESGAWDIVQAELESIGYVIAPSEPASGTDLRTTQETGRRIIKEHFGV